MIIDLSKGKKTISSIYRERSSYETNSSEPHQALFLLSRQIQIVFRIGIL